MSLAFDPQYKYGYPDDIWFSLEDMPGEEWRNFEDQGKFQVSNFGRVRSLFQIIFSHGQISHRFRIKILCPHFDKKQYPCASLSFGKQNHRIIRIHRLVARAFLTASGVIPPEMQVHHKNGIKKDNRIENLEILNSSDHSKKDAKLGLKKCNPEKIGIFQRQRQASMSWLEKKKSFGKMMQIYFFLSPDQKIYKVVGLHGFCCEFGLDRAAMLRLTRGRNNIYKGWRSIGLVNNCQPDVIQDYSTVL